MNQSLKKSRWVTAVLIACSAATAMADEPEREAAIAFLEPLVGHHRLGGDAGCEILEVDRDEHGSRYGVLIRNSKGAQGAKLVDHYTKEEWLSVDDSTLKLDMRIYTGHFNLKGLGVKATLKKNRDGSLREVVVKNIRYNEFGIGETIDRFRCHSE